MLENRALMSEIQSLDDVRALLKNLPVADDRAAAAAREPQLTKPGGSLGRLEDIAEWLAAWQARHPATAAHIKLAVFAGVPPGRSGYSGA